MSTATMAKRKAKPETPKVDREWVASIKGTPQFRDWLYKLADHERMTAVQLIERAVVEYARNAGFPDPAPKRTK